MKVNYTLINANKVLSPDKLFTCNKCRTEKPETHFRIDKTTKSGHRYSCLVCEEYGKHKRDCKWRKLETTLTSEDFYMLKSRPCVYCDGETWTNDRLKINGIDRVDNEQGYHISNCEPCCVSCNTFKSNKSVAYLMRFSINFSRVIEKRSQSN